MRRRRRSRAAARRSAAGCAQHVGLRARLSRLVDRTALTIGDRLQIGLGRFIGGLDVWLACGASAPAASRASCEPARARASSARLVCWSRAVVSSERSSPPQAATQVVISKAPVNRAQRATCSSCTAGLASRPRSSLLKRNDAELTRPTRGSRIVVARDDATSKAAGLKDGTQCSCRVR